MNAFWMQHCFVKTHTRSVTGVLHDLETAGGEIPVRNFCFDNVQETFGYKALLENIDGKTDTSEISFYFNGTNHTY